MDTASTARPRKIVVAALIRDAQDRVLLSLRKSDQPMGGLWELPGGKLEDGESPMEALVREIREEIGCDIVVGRVDDVIFHRYGGFDLLMIVYQCEILAGEPCPLEVAAIEWVAATEVADRPLLPADIPFAQRLRVEARRV
jgi:8-oxo-dGTP diphosphatase